MLQDCPVYFCFNFVFLVFFFIFPFESARSVSIFCLNKIFQMVRSVDDFVNQLIVIVIQVLLATK